MKPLILLIEDDAQIRRFLRAALDAEVIACRKPSPLRKAWRRPHPASPI